MVDQIKPLPVSRRALLKAGTGMAGVGAVTGWLGSFASQLVVQGGNSAIAAELPLNTPDLTPTQALQKLVDGNQRFVQRKRQNPHQDLARLTEVAQDQRPFAAILSCADSRVTPEIIFDQGIGDLFVVRVAGNIATIEEIASQEFGALVLGAKVLMVLGHSRCGAVKAALTGGDLPGLIASLVYAIQPAVHSSEHQPGDRLENAIKMNVQLQVRRLAISPVLSNLVDQGQLKLVGGYYDLDTGVVSLII